MRRTEQARRAMAALRDDRLGTDMETGFGRRDASLSSADRKARLAVSRSVLARGHGV